MKAMVGTARAPSDAAARRRYLLCCAFSSCFLTSVFFVTNIAQMALENR